MILLHHPEVELSRTLLALLPEGSSALDWTGPERETYAGPEPSAFPSVLLPVAAYSREVPAYDAEGQFLGITRETVPGTEELLRLPASWEAVQDFVNFAQRRAEANPPA